MVTRTYTKGQMPLEEEVIQGGSVQSLTRNFLGGRGLEAITTTENNVTTTAYPLYDTHGNMVATLTKNASGTSWNVGNERSYDVWGGVRSGSATGGPKGRYCANLGHVQDDESGLIYMRARYYEPSTGRFISEDPARDGLNWFVYGSNSPTIKNDPDGHVAQIAVNGASFGAYLYFIVQFMRTLDPQEIKKLMGAVINQIVLSYGISHKYAIEAFGEDLHDIPFETVHGKKPKFKPHLRRIASNSTVAAFYAGYAMYLLTLIDYFGLS